MALSKCISKIDKTGLELIEHGVTSFPIACYHDDLQREAVDWHWHRQQRKKESQKGRAGQGRPGQSRFPRQKGRPSAGSC